MKSYVVDTSVAVKWFMDSEKDSDKALNLRQQLLDGDCNMSCPDLLLYELANALRHAPTLGVKDVQAAMGSILDMGLVIKPVDAAVLDRGVELAFKNGVTVYDACFMALAEIEKRSLLTADYKLANSLRGFESLQRLSEL